MRFSDDGFAIRLGSRIFNARRRAELSQEALATALGITQPQLLKYERGVNRVPAVMLQALARELHLPVAMFFDPKVR